MKALCFALLISLTLPIWGCAQSPAEPVDMASLPAPVTEWTVGEGITLSLVQDEYPVGVQSLTMRLENRGDGVMLYGNGWSFEKWEDGAWQPLPNREDAAWTAEGYTLAERSSGAFTISTSALEEPLGEGLYRVTGCTLRVAEDDENLSAGGNYTEYPAYQLEFAVKKDALPDRGYPEESAPPGGLLPKEDWEWHTPWEMLTYFEGRGRTVWQYVQDDTGLMALLWREGTVSDGLNEGDRLCLSIADRVNGEVVDILPRPTLEHDGVGAVEGGFDFMTSCGKVQVRRDGEGFTLAGDWQTGPYTMEAPAVYPSDAESIPVMLANGGKGGGISYIPRLERLTERGWEALTAEAMFCGTLDPFPVGEQEWEIPLRLYGGLTAGLYQVSCEVRTSGEEGRQASALFVLE